MKPAVFATLATAATVVVVILIGLGMTLAPATTGVVFMALGLSGGCVLMWNGFREMWRSRS